MADQRKGMFQASFSLGNLVVLGTMIASLAVGWSRLETGLAHHDDRITETEQELKELRRDQRGFETSVAGLRSDMKHLLTEMARTRETIERLERERRLGSK